MTEQEKLKISIKAEVETGLLSQKSATELADMIDAGKFDDDINDEGWQVMDAIDQIDMVMGLAKISGWSEF
tara:strand:- start:338 stop:550 length:213 start_codon:yes stop_codon:yes gene_type:complete